MENFSEYYNKYKLIFENLSTFSSEFEKQFGDILYSKEDNYEIVKDDLFRIFDILNKVVFDNSLKRIDIIVEKFDRNKHKTANGDYFIGQHVIEFDPRENFDIEKDELPKSLKNYILIVDFGRINFYNLVSIMCHEMIHYKDLIYGPGRNGFFYNAYRKISGKTGGEYDPHGLFFELESKRIKSNFGLDIKKDYEMNKNMIKESDGLYVENNSDENTIKIARVIRNSLKKDGYNNIEVIDNKIRISIN